MSDTEPTVSDDEHVYCDDDLEVLHALTILFVLLTKRTERFGILETTAETEPAAYYGLLVDAIDLLLPTARSWLAYVHETMAFPKGLQALLKECNREIQLVARCAKASGVLYESEFTTIRIVTDEVSSDRGSFVRDRTREVSLRPPS